MLADENYGRLDAQEHGHYRTIMGAPMLREGDLVGVLSVWRNEVDPFDNRSMELLSRFASQAAVAVRNRDLVRALELQKMVLDRKVEHLEGLRQIGEAVNSTLDLDRVFETIVEHAVELSGADGGSLLEYQPEADRFVARAVYGTSDEVLQRLRQIDIPLADTFVGRAADKGHPLQLTDLASEPLDDHLRALLDAGWRSIVAVPMLRQGEILGVLVVRAKLPREVADDICDFLQTFANQSAIAMANARLYAKLRRYLPKQVADLIIENGDLSKLNTHRATIAVVFCDLRGFTSFTEVAVPEDVMAVLGEMHVAFGGLIAKYDGTLERFTGDGLMVFFNDPTTQEDYNLRAIHMAIEMQAEARRLSQIWARKDFQLALGIGIADGWATVGPIGFEGRTDYAAIGAVTNKAARLCAEAKEWQTLVTTPVSLAADESVVTKPLGDRKLKGLPRSSSCLRGPRARRRTGRRGVTTMTTLSMLSDAQRYEIFDDLQATMPDVWDAIGRNLEGESVVVIPSVTLDKITERSGSLTQAYEERFLFLLLLLRQPRLRLVYVTSMPIAPTIIEYYLALLSGVIPSHARSRLLPGVGRRRQPGSAQPEAARPARAAPADRRARSPTGRCRTSSRTTRPSSSGTSPSRWGSPCTAPTRDWRASAPRRAAAGCSPRRASVIRSATRTSIRSTRWRTRCDDAGRAPDHRGGDRQAQRGRVRHGQRAGRPPRPARTRRRREHDDTVARLRAMQFESDEVTIDPYLAKLAERGGIVEERITGVELRSPSVQLRTLPTGEVELLSTHDQLLGGKSGQSYLGCCFPADPDYAAAISDEAAVIGDRLAREGVLGRFAVDFVVVKDEAGAWTIYAIELNLRKGGTTHPFLTLQFLTDGRYEASTGRFLTAEGREKHLVATDHFEEESLRALTVDDLFDIVARHGLHFDQARQSGVVFHMISCLTESGQVGLTAVGDTPEQAKELKERAERTLLAEAATALEEVAIAPPPSRPQPVAS